MTDAADRTAPHCQECHCQTGGGEFCYQHAPYTVYPKADGSYLSDRNGRHRVWLVPEPSQEAELATLRAQLQQAEETIRQLQEQQAALVALVAQLQEKVKDLEARVGDTQYDSPLATAAENKQVPTK
jgi:predicted transcriptional regulator